MSSNQPIRVMTAAVERARLTVVPARALARTQAARTPFAVLVITLLVAGVVGLLAFNTQMQQTSFVATSLQQRADTLTAREQSLTLELDALRQPQQVAQAAQELGMVAPSAPAFLRISDGRVLGVAAPATGAENLQINPAPVEKPAALVPEVRKVYVDEDGKPIANPDASTSRTTGAASADPGR
jgi:cell division protein FtsB